MRKIWPFSFYFLMFAATAFVAPFLVLYYQELGFTGAQIGLLTGIVPLITLFAAPLWTGLADATRRHRLVMSLGILGAAFSAAVFPFLHAFIPVLIIMVLLYSFVAPVNPLADSATMSMLSDEKKCTAAFVLVGPSGLG